MRMAVSTADAIVVVTYTRATTIVVRHAACPPNPTTASP